MRLVMGLILISACTSSSPPCDLTHLEDAPAAGPGEVRYGFAVDQEASVVATPSGVACLTCGTIFYLDSTLREQRRVGVDLAGSGVLAVSDGATIVFDRDFGQDSDLGADDYRPPHFQMFAVSVDGHEQWRNDFADGEAWTGKFPTARLNGPQSTSPEVVFGPENVVVYGVPLASVFLGGLGRLRWTTPAGRGDALVPDTTSGLFLASASIAGSTTPQATLRHLNSEGGSFWKTTWSPTETQSLFGADITFKGAGRMNPNGLVVAGVFTTATLDLGGHVLQCPTGPIGPNRANFVAALDSAGGTQWAVAAGTTTPTGYVDIRKLAATSDGAVICGNYAGTGQLGLPDTDGSISVFVARVGAGGAITAHPISGKQVSCEGLTVAEDDSTIVVVASGSTLDSAAIRVGSRTFDNGPNPKFYVLNISP